MVEKKYYWGLRMWSSLMLPYAGDVIPHHAEVDKNTGRSWVKHGTFTFDQVITLDNMYFLYTELIELPWNISSLKVREEIEDKLIKTLSEI